VAHVTNYIHTFTGLWNRPAKCRIRVYRLESGMTVVIATELPDNPGTTITNAAELLATEIRQRLVTAGEAMVWIEHYQERGVVNGAPTIQETFDRVLFRWDGNRYDDPQWLPFSRKAVEQLIGEPLGE
jgi:hypothetical protein